MVCPEARANAVQHGEQGHLAGMIERAAIRDVAAPVMANHSEGHVAEVMHHCYRRRRLSPGRSSSRDCIGSWLRRPAVSAQIQADHCENRRRPDHCPRLGFIAPAPQPVPVALQGGAGLAWASAAARRRGRSRRRCHRNSATHLRRRNRQPHGGCCCSGLCSCCHRGLGGHTSCGPIASLSLLGRGQGARDTQPAAPVLNRAHVVS